jgi:DnaJ-class molecular chaperone
MNYYKILEIEPTSSIEEIKKAYHRLSLKFHPDKTRNDKTLVHQFQQITEAYKTLSDEESRKKHDQNIYIDAQISSNTLVPSSSSNEMILSQLLSLMQLNNSSATSVATITSLIQTKPAPIVRTLSITMENVWSGCKKPIIIERWVVQEDSVKTIETVTLYVDIFQGIDDNEIILLQNQGHVVSETCKGDVKVFVHVENSTLFQRQGLDLLFHKTIRLEEALCGFEFTLTHLNSKTYTIRNLEGNIISPGFKKQIDSMGLKRVDMHGHLFIVFDVVFPKTMSVKVVRMLKKLFSVVE